MYQTPKRSDELYHFGVLGMKWGVRRYQNYDGSYTQKGMEHYRESEKNYKSKKEAYKVAKKKASKKGYTDQDGTTTYGTKLEKKQAKTELKIAERQLKNDYKQLKRDKAGDKGKRLYESGHTITGNQGKVQAAKITASVGSVAVTSLYNAGYKKEAKYAAAVTAGALAAEGVLAGVGAYQNKQLRAFYGHSRPRTNPRR